MESSSAEDGQQKSAVPTVYTPLLGEQRQDDPQRNPPMSFSIAKHWTMWKLAYISGMFVFVLEFSTFFGEASRLRLLEAAICQRYHVKENPSLIQPDGDVPEMYCKLDPIQVELALIRSWSTAFDCCIGIISGLPWGIVADKHGKRFVAILAVSGLILGELWYLYVCYFRAAFNPRAVWGTSFFSLIGGGGTVIQGVLLGVCAGAVNSDYRAVILSQIQACIMVASIFSPPLGALALNKLGYWIPNLISDATLIFGSILLWWMPTNPNLHDKPAQDEARDSSDATSQASSNQLSQQSKYGNFLHDTYHRACSYISDATNIFGLGPVNPVFYLGLLILVLTKAHGPLLTFMPQFASKRFGWTISKASYLRSIQAVGGIFVLTVILPTLNKAVRRWTSIHGPALDLKMVQGGLPFQVTGLLLLGLAEHPAVFIFGLFVFVLGIGARPGLESYLSSLVRREQLATLYVLMGIMDTIGILVASPLVSVAFSRGLHLGGSWIGLPYIGASVLYFFGALLAWSSRVPLVVVREAQV